MSNWDVAVVVVSKFPEPGRVKTRLSPGLTAAQAADVHRIFLLHVARRLSSLRPAELVICYDHPVSRTAMRDLMAPVCAASYLPQTAGDMGERLASAAASVGARNARMLFLGVDSPDVPASHLMNAVRLLDRSDVCLGPAADGGYWCLGLRSHVDARRLLSNIEWSSGREMAQTRARAAELGYAATLADPWNDVDYPADLLRLLERLVAREDADDRRLLTSLREALPLPPADVS